jgi:hypothetical protein
LRAKATIMGLRVPRAFSVRAQNHCAKALCSFRQWSSSARHDPTGVADPRYARRQLESAILQNRAAFCADLGSVFL